MELLEFLKISRDCFKKFHNVEALEHQSRNLWKSNRCHLLDGKMVIITCDRSAVKVFTRIPSHQSGISAIRATVWSVAEMAKSGINSSHSSDCRQLRWLSLLSISAPIPRTADCMSIERRYCWSFAVFCKRRDHLNQSCSLLSIALLSLITAELLKSSPSLSLSLSLLLEPLTLAMVD